MIIWEIFPLEDFPMATTQKPPSALEITASYPSDEGYIAGLEMGETDLGGDGESLGMWLPNQPGPSRG